MEPSVCFTCWAMPAEPEADWPPLACQDFSSGYFQSLGAASPRYLLRFLVVPDSSERWKAWMSLAGSLAFGLSFWIAGSFHFLIFESKILASVGASRTRSFTPERLYETATGPPTIGRLMPWPLLQTFLDSLTSPGSSAESEPAKEVVPCSHSWTPPPEPMS